LILHEYKIIWLAQEIADRAPRPDEAAHQRVFRVLERGPFNGSPADSLNLRREVKHRIEGKRSRIESTDGTWQAINRRVSNGDQVTRVAALAMKRGKSVDFTGYWQRHIAN
jgi:hypothetical protein